MAADRGIQTGGGRPRTKVATTVADVAEILAESSSALNMSQIAQTVLLEWGGPVQFAQDLRREFQEAKPGSIARMNIMKSMMSLINLGAPKSNVDSVANLSDEDLQRTLQGLLAKAAGPVQGASDGPQGIQAQPST